MKGIFFKSYLIPKVADGTKTVTRRAESGLREINREPDRWDYVEDAGDYGFLFASKPLPVITGLIKPRYQVGETVYIKEAWAISYFTAIYEDEHQLQVVYKDGTEIYFTVDYKTWEKYATQKYCSWNSPLFMPEWAARYHIKFLSARPERLQEITVSECKKEGIEYLIYPNESRTYEGEFERLWNSIHPDLTFERNPWVFRYEFIEV